MAGLPALHDIELFGYNVAEINDALTFAQSKGWRAKPRQRRATVKAYDLRVGDRLLDETIVSHRSYDLNMDSVSISTAGCVPTRFHADARVSILLPA